VAQAIEEARGYRVRGDNQRERFAEPGKVFGREESGVGRQGAVKACLQDGIGIVAFEIVVVVV